MFSPNRKSDSKTYPNWLDLPIELWAAISKHLTSIHDYISFRGVCSSWRSAATFDNFDRAIPRVPWLMFVSGEEKEKKEGNTDKDVKRVGIFFDSSTNKAYKTNHFYQTAGKRYLSCGGWILCVSESNSHEVYLTHPVWRVKIELPGLDTLPEYKHEDGVCYIRKMIFSGSPTRKSNFVVMVICGKYSKQLVFSSPGNSSWTVMDKWDTPFCDILYRNGRLYGVDSSKRVVECDIHGPNSAQILQVFNLPIDYGDDIDNDPIENTYYLVESSSSGKFLIVSRSMMNGRTFRFGIFEFDLKDGSHKEIKHIGNRALFLGFNSSICIELSDWDVAEPNRIYFTDDHSGESVNSDMGVYCLLGMLTKGFLPEGLSGPFITPPTWVVPSF